MQAYVISYSRYVTTASIALYTLFAFIALPLAEKARSLTELVQKICLGVFMVNAYLTLSVLIKDENILIFGFVQYAVMMILAYLYRMIYKSANKLMFNNICMLLAIGLVMITRINQAKAVKQSLIALAGLVFVLLFPIVRRKLDYLRKGCYLYGILGIGMLMSVLALGAITNGSKLSYSIAGITFQPSEFVKILFLLFLASAFSEERSRNQMLMITVLAMAHVGILVLSKDLGSALIYFVVYVSMLFIATGKWTYLGQIFLLGVVGSIVSFFLFSHVRIRVQVFLDPWKYIDGSGYQITQSLFAISFGGWFGAGLTQGSPGSIPFVESDFIFAAIVEEMGIIVGICLLLLCLNILINFLMLSSGYSNKFYQLYTFGTGIAFIFQAFLTVGGGVKFIPLTGVTLPLVSYGGSSVLATIMMFGIVGAIFMLQEERMIKFQIRYENEQKMKQQENEQREKPKKYFWKKPGSSGNDFYENEFKGVPIYDPSKDYEGMNHFDI